MTNAFLWLGMVIVAAAVVLKYAANVDHLDAAVAIGAVIGFGLTVLVGPCKLVVRTDGKDVVIAKGFKGNLERIAAFVDQVATHNAA